MARKKKKQSLTQKQYNKERKRIQRFIRNAQKRGFIFPENILPARPKRITKASVSRLTKLTPKELYRRASYIKYETGEIISGTKRRAEERREARQRAEVTRIRHKMERSGEPVAQESAVEANDYDEEWQAPLTSEAPPPTFDIIERTHEKIDELPAYKWIGRNKQYFYQPHVHFLHSLLDDRVDVAEKDGNLHDYIIYLESVESQIVDTIDEALQESDSEKITNALTRAATLIKGATLTTRQSIDLEEYLEYYENYELPL